MDFLMYYRWSDVRIWLVMQSRIMYQVLRGDRVYSGWKISLYSQLKDLLCLACGICLYCGFYSEITSNWCCSGFLLVESFYVIIYAVSGRSVISATVWWPNLWGIMYNQCDWFSAGRATSLYGGVWRVREYVQVWIVWWAELRERVEVGRQGW